MTTETVCIPMEEYVHLKMKETVADDLLLQLESSLKDLEEGRIKNKTRSFLNFRAIQYLK